MRVAFYAGSFDPVTLGHLDLVERACGLFDTVVVAVGHNPGKRGWFEPEERLALFREALPHDAPVRFVAFEGLAVRAAAREGATLLLRGVRGPADLELELRNASANRELSGIETVLLPTTPALAHVSSSLVREIAACGGDVARYVPPGVLAALARREASSSR